MTATINNQAYITSARNAVTQLLTARSAIIAMQDQWNAEDYGNTLMDGTSTNAGVTAAMVGAALFDAMTAITTVMNTGIATDLYNLMQN